MKKPFRQRAAPAVIRLADSAQLANEVVQDAFVRAWEQLGSYRPEGTFLPWLKAIARHLLADHWRARRRQAQLSQDLLIGLLAEDLLAEMDGDGSAAEAEGRRLQDCIDRLPPHSRVLLLRRYRDGRELSELARDFKRQRAVIIGILHRIRCRVRACLDAHGKPTS